MSVPEDIYTIILVKYTNVQYNYAICKKIEIARSYTLNKSINLINKCIYKHIANFRIEMDYNYFYMPKVLYKRFYPLKDRISIILSILKLKDHESYDYQKELYEEILTKPNHLVLNFNKIIDTLNENDLYRIGW